MVMRNKRKIKLLMTRNFCIDKVDDLNDDELRACMLVIVVVDEELLK